jgi:hypothetical protein
LVGTPLASLLTFIFHSIRYALFNHCNFHSSANLSISADRC